MILTLRDEAETLQNFLETQTFDFRSETRRSRLRPRDFPRPCVQVHHDDDQFNSRTYSLTTVSLQGYHKC